MGKKKADNSTDNGLNIKPTLKGYKGDMLGYSVHTPILREWQGTSVQVCGLWPFSVGASMPRYGVPVGFHLWNRLPFYCDPISWFTYGKLISNPSFFVLGRPGLGKSTLIRKQIIGMVAQGIFPMVLGDIKPDYKLLFERLGGQVVSIAKGQQAFNILNPGGIYSYIISNPDKLSIKDELLDRQSAILNSVIAIMKGEELNYHERVLIVGALKLLNNAHQGSVPTLYDLVKIFIEPPDELRKLAIMDTEDQYASIVKMIRVALHGLLEGVAKDVLSVNEDCRIDLNKNGICYDISALNKLDSRLQGAIMMACWNEGFSAIELHNRMVDAGYVKQKRFYIVLDELWRVLGFGKSIINEIDALTRLNRTAVSGLVMITHTLKDLLAITDEASRIKATGFIDRAGAIICSGLSPTDVRYTSEIVNLSQAESDLLIGWSSSSSWSVDNVVPPGCGNFLVKIGDNIGIPFNVYITKVETEIHDTNQRWKQ